MQEILNHLKEILELIPAAHAMWLEGSLVEGFNDKFSDVDLWVDVDDGHEQKVYDLIENCLGSKGTLDVDFELHMDHPKIRHKTYHIAGTSRFERLEVNVQSHSRNFQLVEGLHDIKMLFDKDGTLKKVPLDKQKHQAELAARKKFLLEKVNVGEVWLEKELVRRNFLEALHNYHSWLVEPVVELARIKYSPYKISFGLKHISRDLPGNIVSQIESLYGVKNIEEVQAKLEDIKVLANELSK